MAEQNFKNHSQLIPAWHGVTALILLTFFVGSIVNVFICKPDNCWISVLLVLSSFSSVSIFWFCRVFALKAQDRAIRVEENFRHFILTGKPFDSQLKLRQIIALRFATDAEFGGLAQRAVEENLSSKQIKESITNWKADTYRV